MGRKSGIGEFNFFPMTCSLVLFRLHHAQWTSTEDQAALTIWEIAARRDLLTLVTLPSLAVQKEKLV
jgi:hypothetical protein